MGNLKKDSFICSPDSRVDNSILDYISRHKAKWLVAAELIDTGKKRIASKDLYCDGILLSGHLLSWLFTNKRVGKDSMLSYRTLCEEIAASCRFVTTQGEFTSADVRVMIIAPDLKEVYVVTKSDIICRLCYSEFRNKKVEAKDISEVHLRVSDKVKSVITKEKHNFKALSDFCNVMKHLCPDIELNSSIKNINLFREALDTLDQDDDELRVLIEMAPHLLDDMRLIYSNIDIYWG